MTAKLISTFVFATRIVQSPYFLNPKFHACRHLLWLYSSVYIGPGRKPRRPVFSQRGSYGTLGTLFPRNKVTQSTLSELNNFIICILHTQKVKIAQKLTSITTYKRERKPQQNYCLGKSVRCTTLCRKPLRRKAILPKSHLAEKTLRRKVCRISAKMPKK